jgi:hypothetical protein
LPFVFIPIVTLRVDVVFISPIITIPTTYKHRCRLFKPAIALRRIYRDIVTQKIVMVASFQTEGQPLSANK